MIHRPVLTFLIVKSARPMFSSKKLAAWCSASRWNSMGLRHAYQIPDPSSEYVKSWKWVSRANISQYFIQRFRVNFPTSSVTLQDLVGSADSVGWSLLHWLAAFRRKLMWNLENLPKKCLDEDFSIWKNYFLWGWVGWCTSGQSLQDILVTNSGACPPQ